MMHSEGLARIQFYQSVLESCLISPVGVQLGSVLSNSLERSLACEELLESRNFKQLVSSVGAKIRPEFSFLSEMDLSRFLARGLFLYEGMVSDVLGVCLAATEVMESSYVEEHQLVSEIRYLSISFCGTQHVGTIDALVLKPWSFNDLNWRRAISWVTLYDQFDDVKKTSLLIKAIKLGLNINEGDFMIRPRFRGMKSADLKTVISRCGTGIQNGLSTLLSLLNVVLFGLNRVIAKMDMGVRTSILDRNEVFAKIYYACCQLADSLDQRPGGYEYLLQRANTDTWITQKRTGSPSWAKPSEVRLSPHWCAAGENGFVSQITAHGKIPAEGWRYVRTST